MGQIVTYGVIGLCVIAWVVAFFRPFFAQRDSNPAQHASSDDDDDSFLKDPEFNSANGLPMMFGMDINGNPDGVDNSLGSTFTDNDD
ncbi:hypothetical protein [Massilia varians]|jgi:hypothetical protein|uniref:hypothetical protein n=1 Tax=Massilia varians TaxID=457921 RepID=UPI002557C4EB|nr:hypothetical protein [Massilia varians]MDK6079499.1 hypothetical protein [Massilia varians]